jgi:hypothetical protein
MNINDLKIGDVIIPIKDLHIRGVKYFTKNKKYRKKYFYNKTELRKKKLKTILNEEY